MESEDEPTAIEIDEPAIAEPIAVSSTVSDPSYPSIWQSFGILLIFLLCTVAAVPIMLVLGQVDADVAMLLFYIVAGGLGLAIVHSIRKRKLGKAAYRFGFQSWRIVLPLIIASIGLLFGVIAPLISLIPMPSDVNDGFADLMGQPSLAMFLTLVVAAPLLEELLFRGIMLDGLLKRYRPMTAILVSSIIFGLAHLNPWQFVTAFVIGCFAGWVYLRTRSLGPCMLIHATVNFCAYLIQVLAHGASIAEQPAADSQGGSAVLIFMSMCLVAVAVSIHQLRREFDRPQLAEAISDDTGEIGVSST